MPPEIRLIPYLGAERPEDFVGAATVVIDILRATTTMTTAIGHGAPALWPAASVEEARALKREHPGALLGGEVDLDPPPGFEAGNSPLDYTKAVLLGREVILATTNGTRALRAGETSSLLFAMSLLNLSQTARALPASGPVVLFASGRQGAVAEEDLAAAGGLLALIGEGRPVDGPWTSRARSLWERARHDPEAYLQSTPNGRRLEASGRGRDVKAAAQLDTVPIVLTSRGGRIERG